MGLTSGLTTQGLSTLLNLPVEELYPIYQEIIQWSK